MRKANGIGWIFGVSLLVGVMVGHMEVSAQGRGGPEPRSHYGGQGGRTGEGRINLIHGYCYSGRTQTCSAVFSRETVDQIAQECGAQGWRRYQYFERGHQAREARANPQACVNQ